MTTLTPAAQVSAWGEDPTLHGYAAFVCRYRGMMVVVLLVGIVIGLIVHLNHPLRYTSTAHMVIVASPVSGDPEGDSDLSIDSAVQLLRSDEVLGKAAQGVGYPGGTAALKDDLTTRPIVNSRIVRVSVSALDPADAQLTASAVAERFFEVRADGLRKASEDRASAVSAEIDVVEAELARRYGLSPTEDAAGEDPNGDDTRRTLTRIAPLVTLRAQLHVELAALATSESDPGYLSRPATTPLRGGRSGLAITMSSSVTLSLLAAVGLGSLHQMRLRDRQPGADTHLSEGSTHDGL